ncbi:MAG: hypothetical protein P9M14_10160 [Candidatus Alcyoniella australis]|nr:hypothetical protein [Candidatus Alcyoniella australis]
MHDKRLFPGLMIALALIVFLLLPIGCVDCGSSNDDDLDDDEHPCDRQCYLTFLDGSIVCQDQLIECVDACDEYDQACIDACEDVLNDCGIAAYERLIVCAQQCGDCLDDYFVCLEDCPDEDPDLTECRHACNSAMYSCGGWDAACFDGCESRFNNCIDEDCYGYDPACTADCRKEAYICQQDCLQ